MEEVNDNELPMEPLLYPAVATGGEELPPMSTGSVDGQVCAADVAAAAEGGDEPQASEQSIGQIDPKTLGWTRRWPNAGDDKQCWYSTNFPEVPD